MQKFGAVGIYWYLCIQNCDIRKILNGNAAFIKTKNEEYERYVDTEL